MPILKLTVQYDGTDYVGWQRQPNGISIQSLLEDALAPIEGKPVTVHGAGRTDAGVHALGQVASVDLSMALDSPTLARALNAVLPPAVRVLAVDAAAPDFHARFSARSKTYEYRIVTGPLVSAFSHRYVWHVPQPLDIDLMRVALAPLMGAHDFAAFQGAGSSVASTERTILGLDVEPGGGFDRPLVVRITGDGFLRHMVRTIVGTAVDIGLGRWQPARMSEVLESRQRSEAGPTAPARGLFLTNVRYGDAANAL
jgi:tRNA pseudouridine38-40 synthase